MAKKSITNSTVFSIKVVFNFVVKQKCFQPPLTHPAESLKIYVMRKK